MRIPAALVVVMIGCAGDPGPMGGEGQQGQPGQQGPQGQQGAMGDPGQAGVNGSGLDCTAAGVSVDHPATSSTMVCARAESDLTSYQQLLVRGFQTDAKTKAGAHVEPTAGTVATAIFTAGAGAIAAVWVQSVGSASAIQARSQSGATIVASSTLSDAVVGSSDAVNLAGVRGTNFNGYGVVGGTSPAGLAGVYAVGAGTVPALLAEGGARFKTSNVDMCDSNGTNCQSRVRLPITTASASGFLDGTAAPATLTLTATCPTNGVVLGGGCSLPDSSISLQQTVPNGAGNGWTCVFFRSSLGSPFQVNAFARCLTSF